MNYFFDTYAIIELIKGNPKYEFVKDQTIVTGVMNVAEVYYALLLENSKDIVDTIIKKCNFHFIIVSPEIAIESAVLRYKYKKSELSYIDCVGYILSLHNHLIFLTGDKGFQNLDNVTFVPK